MYLLMSPPRLVILKPGPHLHCLHPSFSPSNQNSTMYLLGAPAKSVAVFLAYTVSMSHLGVASAAEEVDPEVAHHEPPRPEVHRPHFNGTRKHHFNGTHHRPWKGHHRGNGTHPDQTQKVPTPIGGHVRPEPDAGTGTPEPSETAAST
jgi:hypothetical protein